LESYEAAAIQGAGIIECDVTFTADKELVCRHSQCDLHTTTDILLNPTLAAKCTEPFVPAEYDTDGNMTSPATAQCCTSDITLAEFKTLCGKMDGADNTATTAEEYVMGTPAFRTDLFSTCGTLVTHAESIDLIKGLGAKFTPELKSPSVAMPFDGFTQEDYAQKMIDEYKAASVDPSSVWAQSFNVDDVYYWITNESDFGNQAVFLDDVDTEADLDAAIADFDTMVSGGVKIIAPPMWALVTVEDGQIVPSEYAKKAKEAGLGIITLDRSGPLKSGGGWYFQSITDVTDNDGVYYELLDVLAQDVGILGIFSDWPATVTYYATCFDL
jgi:glycerophosphoryl diester phosphodiesterase